MQIDPQSAINAALQQDWTTAININQELVKKNSHDLAALCRLAYALTHKGNIEKAKKIYKKILAIDKYNSIALKNYQKIDSYSNRTKNSQSTIKQRVDPSLFIEEPGKTKTIQLTNLAPISVTNLLCIGDMVFLHAKKHSIEVRTSDKTYMGALPDDIAFRLIKFINAGNSYLACVKNVQKKSVTVFIREVARGKRLLYQPTFLPGSMPQYTTSMPREMKESLIANEEDTSPPDQEESEE